MLNNNKRVGHKREGCESTNEPPCSFLSANVCANEISGHFTMPTTQKNLTRIQSGFNPD